MLNRLRDGLATASALAFFILATAFFQFGGGALIGWTKPNRSPGSTRRSIAR